VKRGNEVKLEGTRREHRQGSWQGRGLRFIALNPSGVELGVHGVERQKGTHIRRRG